MRTLLPQIQEAADYVRARFPTPPEVGIILGTGLGSLAERIERPLAMPFEEVPHFLRSTAESHCGQLVAGWLADVPVLAMAGRLHAYEGYPLKTATLGVRVMKALGADLLIASNAAGGLNPRFAAGEIMVIDDHINLMRDNPLIGVNADVLGPRFPDMSQPYDERLIQAALAIARRREIVCHRGVYVAVTGPNLETRAEYRMLRALGGDVAGMSTVPEVLVAIHGGMRVLAFSVVSNVCLPDDLRPMTIDEIVATSAAAEANLREMVTGILGEGRHRAS